jgi:hypothetical protein
MPCTDGPSPPQEEDCPPGRCGKLTKPFFGAYYGAGNYYYVARLLQLASHSGTVFLSANDFATAAHRACAVPWLQTRAGWNASSWKHVSLGRSPPATLCTQAVRRHAGCNAVHAGCNAVHAGCNAVHPGCNAVHPGCNAVHPGCSP